jgi:hypothetical protein
MSDYATMMEIAEETLRKEGRLPEKEVRKGPTEDREAETKPEAKE